MFDWLKNLFNKAISAFKDFVAKAFPVVSQMVIGELKDFAIQTVSNLELTALTDSAKRAEAVAKIKAEALKRGLTLKDSLVNTIVEMAVQYVKENK